MAYSITALILTKNEEKFVERCIRGARVYADEVLILDSESTDGTREIASVLGARVILQPWLGWVAQRQYGIAAATHDWIFVIDCDEIADDTLADAIRRVVAGEPDPRDGFNVIRRDEFYGQLMPNFRNRTRQRAFVRLFNRRFSGYQPDHLIHEEVKVLGASIALPGTLVHWRNFRLAEQVVRYTESSALESQQAYENGGRATVLRILLMPLLRFLWVYVAKGAWRTGPAGLVTAMTIAVAEFLRWAALWERQCTVSSPHPPAELLGEATRAGVSASRPKEESL